MKSSLPINTPKSMKERIENIELVSGLLFRNVRSLKPDATIEVINDTFSRELFWFKGMAETILEYC